MYLKLRSLQGNREHVEKRYEPERFESGSDDAYRVVSPVTLTFDIERFEADRYRLFGQVAGEIELSCGRCLEPYRAPVSAAFDLSYVPRAAEGHAEGEREVAAEDLTTAFYADDQIDLGELMSEQFHLALPMKPLCADTCKGLCPQCGTNLNTGSCDCDNQWVDPRLAPLKQLQK